MTRALFLMVLSAVAGLIAWAVREPSAPATFADAAWAQWEGLTGVTLGAFIGFALGTLSGYYQGSRLHTFRGMAIGGIVGGVAGGLGISLGSMIYAMVGGGSFGIGPSPLEPIGRLSGWAIMGAVIGLGQGLSTLSPKRLLYGLVGGLMGGILGGAAFIVVTTPTSAFVAAVADRNETGVFGRAVGFTLIGAGIGLMIGVVEAVAKTAWVRLILGRNEGKDWPIYDVNTFIGRSESAAIPLFGDPQVAPIHAVIQKHRGQYYLSAVDPIPAVLLNNQPVKQGQLASGDLFMIGGYTLQFLTRGGVVTRVQQPMAYQPEMPAQVPAGIGSATGQATVAFPTQSTMAAPARFWIVAQSGPLAGQRFPVDTPMEIGREAGPIPMNYDTQASRRHARVEPVQGGLRVTDLKSTNGTLVRGQRIDSALLGPNETFQVGNTVFGIVQG